MHGYNRGLDVILDEGEDLEQDAELSIKSSKDFPKVTREGSICFFGQQPGDLGDSESGEPMPEQNLECVSIHSSFEIKDKRQ